jgi:hypothetical protein
MQPPPNLETNPMAHSDHVDLDREVIRRDDGVVVVRETDPETGERIERKYPACPVETTAHED